MLQTPIHHRILALGVLVGAAALAGRAAPARAQAWTEADVARLAAERAPDARVAEARARVAQGAVDGAGLYPNPELAWERQEAFDPNAQTQDILTLRVPLDLSGRPLAGRALAEVEAALASAAARGATQDAREAALLLFYTALARERMVALRAEAREALAEAARVIAARESAGEASGYDRARLALEAELARSRVAEARVDAEAAAVGLAALLAEPSPHRLDGELEAVTVPALAALLARVEDREDLAALRDARRAASRARDAAAFAWVPRLSLEGGYNRQDGPIVGHGYAVGVAIEVPLFDHGQGERARADAALAATDELTEARATRARAQVRAAHARLAGLVAERDRYTQATVEPAALLLRAAATGYREGERSLVELLDARRAALEARERALSLSLAARHADIRLRSAAGALP